jgi:hypothetical protein
MKYFGELSERHALNTCAPISRSETVTLSGSTDIADDFPLGVMVTSSGNITGTLRNMETTCVLYLEAGIFYPFSYASIEETGTTATGIVVLM